MEWLKFEPFPSPKGIRPVTDPNSGSKVATTARANMIFASVKRYRQRRNETEMEATNWDKWKGKGGNLSPSFAKCCKTTANGMGKWQHKARRRQMHCAYSMSADERWGL